MSSISDLLVELHLNNTFTHLIYGRQNNGKNRIAPGTLTSVIQQVKEGEKNVPQARGEGECQARGWESAWLGSRRVPDWGGARLEGSGRGSRVRH